VRTDGPGYLLFDPNEVLFRHKMQAPAQPVAGGQLLTFPPNSRRCQFQGGVGSTFTIGDASTIAACVPALIVPGLWVEIPPMCDRTRVTGANLEVIAVTVLHGEP